MSLLQPSLFDTIPPPGRSRRSDPETSKSAARNVKSNVLEEMVVGILRVYPNGLTSHEVADLLQESLVTISPRMRPLANKNLIVDSGEKREGVGFAKSIVWKAK